MPPQYSWVQCPICQQKFKAWGKSKFRHCKSFFNISEHLVSNPEFHKDTVQMEGDDIVGQDNSGTDKEDGRKKDTGGADEGHGRENHRDNDTMVSSHQQDNGNQREQQQQQSEQVKDHDDYACAYCYYKLGETVKVKKGQIFCHRCGIKLNQTEFE